MIFVNSKYHIEIAWCCLLRNLMDHPLFTDSSTLEVNAAVYILTQLDMCPFEVIIPMVMTLDQDIDFSNEPL